MSITLKDFYRGDPYTLRVRCVDTNDDPLDITGWTFRATMKLSTEFSDNDTPAKVDVGPVPSLTGPSGEVFLTFPAEQTKQLLPTRYFIDVQAEHDGETSTLMVSRVRVLSDVTQRDS